MSWGKFTFKGQDYPLDHLDPFDWTYLIEVGDGKAPEKYKFHIEFSHHCFTAKPEAGNEDSELVFHGPCSDGRQFDFYRYKLSERLRKIIESLHEGRCLHTTHGNFIRIEIIDDDGNKLDYEVFFNVSRVKQRGWLRLYVESAYVRDENRKGSRPRTQNIKLRVIARNTLQKRTIRRP